MVKEHTTVRTRFSPSPTGFLHLGNARAALFSALLAAKEKGIFILRVEDTDAARSTEDFITSLQEDLNWLGLAWQEGPIVGGPHAPYQQSKRHEIYDQYYQLLEKNSHAYPCFCSDQELALNRKVQLSRGQAPRYPGTCVKLTQEMVEKKLKEGMKPALRFRMPQRISIEFVDLIKGPQKFNSDDIGDFIIRRADGSSSFMFCNAIDDSLMGVTHVLRGEDHLTNTPRQRVILQTLGLRTPEYGHLSLITGEDGTPLSKRHGSFSLTDLRKQGYLPLAVLNYLSRLGHTYEQSALLSFNELANHFRIDKLSRSSARFDLNQLLFWQKQAVLALSDVELMEWIQQKTDSPLLLTMLRQNYLFPEEANKWLNILLKDEWQLTEENKTILQNAGNTFFETWLKAIEEHGDDLKQILEELKKTLSISGKELFMPMRIALTGELHGPELIQITTLLGQEKVKARIMKVLKNIQSVSC